MKAVIEDFEHRAKEVRTYLRLLSELEVPDTVLRSRASGRIRTTAIREEWRVIGKAAAYLLVYNLVESATRSGFERLYQVIEAEKCTCRTINDALREVWIEQRHRAVTRETASPRNYQETAAKMVKAVIDDSVVQLNAHRLPVSGNLDGDKIRDVCAMHGVVLKSHRNAKGGGALVAVKEQRNALAHGVRSFSDCGREVVVDDLSRMARESEIFVRGFLASLARYIREKRYVLSP